MCETYNKVGRESRIKVHHALDPLHMFIRQRNLQTVEVGGEVLDLAPADDGEDEGGLLHDVCDGNYEEGKRDQCGVVKGESWRRTCGDMARSEFFADFLEYTGHLDLVIASLPVPDEGSATFLVALLAAFVLLQPETEQVRKHASERREYSLRTSSERSLPVHRTSQGANAMPEEQELQYQLINWQEVNTYLQT